LNRQTEINLVIIVGYVKQVCHFTSLTVLTCNTPISQHKHPSHFECQQWQTQKDMQDKQNPSENIQFYKITLKGRLVIRTIIIIMIIHSPML
jgi:hypothetical protein